MKEVYLDFSLPYATGQVLSAEFANPAVRRVNKLANEADYAEIRGETTTTVPIDWVEDSLEVIEQCANPVTETNAYIKKWNQLGDYYESLVDYFEPIPDLLAEGAHFTGALIEDIDNEDWAGLDASLVFFSQTSRDLAGGQTEGFCDDEQEMVIKHALAVVMREVPEVFDEEVGVLSALYNEAKSQAANGQAEFELDIDQVRLINLVFSRIMPAIDLYRVDTIDYQVGCLEEGIYEYEGLYADFIHCLREAAALLRGFPADFLANFDIDQLKLIIWLDKVDALQTASEQRQKLN